MNIRKKLTLKIIHAIKRAIDNSDCSNYNEDIYIDISNKIERTSVIDISYNRIGDISEILCLGRAIFIARILDLNIDNKPIIMITNNPVKYGMCLIDGDDILGHELAMMIKIINGKVCVAYANNSTKSNK